MAAPKRTSKEHLKRVSKAEADDAKALEAIMAEGLAEIETIGKTWGLAPEEVDVILKGKYLPLFIRNRQAAMDIAKNGLMIADNYGRARVSPSIVIEKDSIAGMMRILKQLNIGPESPEPAKKALPWSKTR